jgi:hypothetical protein
MITRKETDILFFAAVLEHCCSVLNLILLKMNEQTRIIYRILEERYVKIAWTHKIQECQSEIHLEEFIKQRNQMGLAAALTSSTAIISLIAKCASFIDNKYILLLIPIITAGLSAWSTYLTFRFKDRVLEKKAEENKHFAAK